MVEFFTNYHFYLIVLDNAMVWMDFNCFKTSRKFLFLITIFFGSEKFASFFIYYAVEKMETVVMKPKFRLFQTNPFL